MSHLESIVNSGLLQYVNRTEYKDAFDQLKIVEKQYAKDEMIFREGDVIDRVCLVVEGSVRSEKTYPDGEIHIVSVFGVDEIFGLEITVSQKKTSPLDFIANEDCTALFLSVKSLNNEYHRERIGKAITEQLADDNIRLGHKVEILAERGLRDRIMVYLNILAKKSGESEVYVPMNREQLAQYLCVNRSALSNELSKMKRDGLIDFKRRKFVLLKKT